MADNDQDEYKFDELNNFDDNSLENPDYGFGDTQPSEPISSPPPRNDARKKVFIAVGILALAAGGYQFVSGMFGTDNKIPKDTIPAAPMAEMQPQQPEAPVPVSQLPSARPAPAPQPVVVQENNSELKQKVDAIESSQQNVQSQVTSVSDQVGNVNSNVNNLSSQISRLNQTISDLTVQLNKQSEEISVLMERTKPKPIRRVAPPRRIGKANIYYINAVIPGRAWLIGPNGSTLTVREGTKIAGYGVVKLIDSVEGRVLTSSGRVIRFNQDDS